VRGCLFGSEGRGGKNDRRRGGMVVIRSFVVLVFEIED
jgi:hypothetical protein